MSSAKHPKTPNKPVLYSTTTKAPSSGKSSQASKKSSSNLKSDQNSSRQVTQKKRQEDNGLTQNSKNKSLSLKSEDNLENEKFNKLGEKPEKSSGKNQEEFDSNSDYQPYSSKQPPKPRKIADNISSQKVDMPSEDENDIKLGQKVRLIYKESNDIDSIIYNIKKAKKFASEMKQEFMPENDNIDDLIENIKSRVFQNDENLQKNENLKFQLKEAQKQISQYRDQDNDDDKLISQTVRSFYDDDQDFTNFSENLKNDLELSQKVRYFFNEEENNDVIMRTIQSNKESADDNSRVFELSSQLQNLSRSVDKNDEVEKAQSLNIKYQQELDEKNSQILQLKKEIESLNKNNQQKANEISELKQSYENKISQLKEELISSSVDETKRDNIADQTSFEIIELKNSYEAKLNEIQTKLSKREASLIQLKNELFEQQRSNDIKQKENMELRSIIENPDDVKNKEITFLKQKLLSQLEKQKELEMSLSSDQDDNYKVQLIEKLNEKDNAISQLKNKNSEQRLIIEQKEREITQLNQSLQNQVNRLNNENSEQRLKIEQKEREINELKQSIQNQGNKLNNSDLEQQTTKDENIQEDNQSPESQTNQLNNEEKQENQFNSKSFEHQPTIQATQNRNIDDAHYQENQANHDSEQQLANEQKEIVNVENDESQKNQTNQINNEEEPEKQTTYEQIEEESIGDDESQENQIDQLNNEEPEQQITIEQIEEESIDDDESQENQTDQLNNEEPEQQTTNEQNKEENINDNQSQENQTLETKEEQNSNNEEEKSESADRVNFDNSITTRSIQQSDDTTPNILSNYELLDSFAQGTFGKVFKVKDKRTGQIYAAKISKQPIVNDSQEKLNLKREVDILSRLNHPAILKFICYSPVNFRNKQKPVIITEYAENQSLSELIKMERESRALKDWNDTTKLIVLYGIASAMTFLHSNNIVHRDLKPSNILIDSHLHPKLADFGLSKIIHSNKSMTTQSIASHKGTPIYMAPEIWSENPEYSEASDVYAFGMIMYEVITNDQPFPNSTELDLPVKIQSGERPSFKYEILQPYEFLIKSCWDQDPCKRPSFADIADQLENDPEFRDFDAFDDDEYQKYIDFIQDCKSKINFKEKSKIDISKYIVEQEQSFKIINVVEEANENKDENNNEEKNGTKRFLCSNEYYDQLDDDRKKLIEEAENDPIKQYIVGQFLVEGIEGFPQETDVGIQYLDKAINSGCVEACNYYCNLLIRGQFVDYNLELAEQYLKPQLDKRNGTTYLLYGRVMRKLERFDEAKRYFRKGAKRGNNEAMYEYGKMMYRGEGGEKDEKEAEEYFNLAKKNGNYKAYEFVYKQQKEEERRRLRNQNKVDEKS